MSQESTEWQTIANSLTMTSFSVVKDEKKDRLISWPRVQNSEFLDPSKVDLPDPSMFSRLRIAANSKLSAFALDIANMFHNIQLPAWLVPFFPLQCVSFGDMPRELQIEVLNRLHPRRRPKQNARFRPHQRTLPMGFKCAVYIAHIIADAAIRDAIAQFQIAQKCPVMHVKFSRQSRLIEVFSRAVLSLHIIDDVNCVFLDWRAEEAVMLQILIHGIFERLGLPIKTAKSTPIGALITDAMKFIGWIWDFEKYTVTPSEEKLCKAAELIRLMTEHGTEISPTQLEKLMGIVTWISMGRRPLLSLFRFVFTAVRSKRVSMSLAKVVKRELTNFATMLPTAKLSLQRPLWSTVITTDASSRAGAVLCATPALKDLERLLRDSLYIGGILPSAGPASTFAKTQAWKTAFVHNWERQSHINLLEAETIIMAVRWAASHKINGSRIVILSDSHVAIAAFAKGRSSSPEMLQQARRLASVCLYHDWMSILCMW